MSEGIIDLFSLLQGGVTGEAEDVDPYEVLTYPVSLPQVSGVRNITWMTDSVNGYTEADRTYQRFYFTTGAGRWRASVELPMMSRENAGKWSSFLMHLRAGEKTFWFGDVFFPLPMGVAFGSPVVYGADQTGRTLNTTGWLSNITNILKAGDKIAVNSCLHQITRDTNADVYGRSTLDIFPPLRSSPIDGATITTHSPRGLFRLNQDSFTASSIDLSRANKPISFEVVEAI